MSISVSAFQRETILLNYWWEYLVFNFCAVVECVSKSECDVVKNVERVSFKHLTKNSTSRRS